MRKILKYGKSNFLSYVILILLSVFFLAPLYVIINCSLKVFAEASPSFMWKLPGEIQWGNFVEAFKTLAPTLLNSIKLVIPATIISTIIGSLNGYVFEKWKFKGSEVLFWLIVFGMFLPMQSVLIPIVKVLQKLHLYNSIGGLILVHVIYGLPVATMMFRNYYTGIPTALMESAEIDGGSFFSIFWKIMIPLSVPEFVVVIIWQFTNIWNDFLFSLVVLTGNNQTVMVAVQNLSSSQVVEWNVAMAGSVIAALPTLLVYLFAGKYFIKGIMSGSVKG